MILMFEVWDVQINITCKQAGAEIYQHIQDGEIYDFLDQIAVKQKETDIANVGNFGMINSAAFSI